MEIKKLWLSVGLSLVTGFIWGRVLDVELPQRYSDPRLSVEKYDQIVSVDVIRNGDDM